MSTSYLINKLNNQLLNKNINFQIDRDFFNSLLIDITRIKDKEVTAKINEIKKDLDLKINSVEKSKLRLYLIGYNIEVEEQIKKYQINISKSDYDEAYKLISIGFERNEELMFNSIIERINKYISNKNNQEEYLRYIKKSQVGKNQLLILNFYSDNNYTSDNIAEIICNKYDTLSNYHYAILIFEDRDDTTFSWELISEVALYMEQFKEEKNFTLYNKSKIKRIEEFINFLKSNNNISYNANIYNLVHQYFECIHYGFHFEDLFITQDGKKKILIMQKIELDELPKKCPECMEEKVRGNSYSRVLYKSFECQNHSCPNRSKSGRGKRFDFYSAKRQMMLLRNANEDKIDSNIYNLFRRDIILEYRLEHLILLYSWKGDTVEIINLDSNLNKYKGRKIINSHYKTFEEKNHINNLPFIKLFKELASSLIYKDNYSILEHKTINNLEIYNGDSTPLIPYLDKTVGGAITSPPYFNVREYSQWSNLYCYLVDMMANAKAVFYKIKENGVYIYNIGDVVDQDNVYIVSNMSKRRQMLGFYSVIIFKCIGFKTIGNIIWDKGEVQSKRNSSANHLSGYIKPINAYEHCFIFSKFNSKPLIKTKVKRIDPVKKINSKGENTLGHTAPYPIEIAKLILPFTNKEDYILDPFLGSGTTLLALLKNGYKGIGIELDEFYYNLTLKRLKDIFSI